MKSLFAVLIGLTICGSANAQSGGIASSKPQGVSQETAGFDSDDLWDDIQGVGLHLDVPTQIISDDTADTIAEVKYEWTPWLSTSQYGQQLGAPTTPMHFNIPSGTHPTQVKVFICCSDANGRIDNTEAQLMKSNGTDWVQETIGGQSYDTATWGNHTIVTFTWSATALASLGVDRNVVNHQMFGARVRASSSQPYPHPSTLAKIHWIIIDVTYAP